MALRWLIHSACHVLGYPASMNNNTETESTHNKEIEIEYPSSSSSSSCSSGFQMPLHYPRYSKADYESMEEWKVDLLLKQYGLSFKGTLHDKRAFAIAAFLWPHQY